MKKRDFIKASIYLFIAVVLVFNTVMTCMLALWIKEDRKSLKNVECSIQDIRHTLEQEIKLRKELFPQLKKSAELLTRYNPRLDDMTAVRYALKIYQCSDDQVPLDILTSLIVVESSANSRAVSRKGALGLTQVMPNIWKYDPKVLVDPYQNIEIGASILKFYVNRYGLIGGLSAYNSGKKHASIRYAKKVVRIASRHF